MAANRMADIEIRVNGLTIHHFLAGEIETHEDRGTLSLVATRWSPTALKMPPNPLLSGEWSRPEWAQTAGTRTPAQTRFLLVCAVLAAIWLITAITYIGVTT